MAGVALVVVIAVVLARFAQDGQTGTATWDAARASGFAGYLLIWGAVVSGIALHLRLRPRSAGLTWMLEVHRILSALGLSFVAAHVIALFLDPVVTFAVVDGLVPFTSAYRPFQVGLGTIATWLLVVVLASTALAGALPLSAWRRLHYLSFACYVLALAHGVTAGSDSGQAFAISVYASTAAMVGALVVLRVAGRGWVEAGELQTAADPR
jgi:sulfoxide reductase heme-binding subunit YedZ